MNWSNAAKNISTFVFYTVSDKKEVLCGQVTSLQQAIMKGRVKNFKNRENKIQENQIIIS